MNISIVYYIHKSIYYALLGILLLSSCSKHNQQYEDIKVKASLNNYFSNLADRGFSGAILIVRNDTILLKRGYGFVNKKRKIEVTPHTIFDIASVGKQFTAAAILKLYEHDKINLGHPVSEYIKSVNWPDNLSKISVHQLLTHTSGITEYYQPASIKLNKKQYLQEIFKIQKESNTNRFSYSNTGYEILAILIEEVSGKSYEGYLTDIFFKPLNMENTGFIGNDKWNENFIARGSGGVKNCNANDGNNTYGNKGAGSIVSSVDDLYKWEKSIRNYKIFNKELTDIWFQKHTIAEVDDLFYGYGWRNNTTERNTTLIWHSGWDDAFNSIYYRYVDEDLTIIFLSNFASGLDPIRNVIFPALKTNIIEEIVFKDSVINDIPKFSNNKLVDFNYYLDEENFLTITLNNQKCLQIYPNGQRLINILFDYKGRQEESFNLLTNQLKQLSYELVKRKINIDTFVNALGPFDEYETYSRNDNWVKQVLRENEREYKKLDSIKVVGTAHSYGNRFNHSSTDLKFFYKDSSLYYSYVDYGGEKYFVENGVNIFNMFLCPSDTMDVYILKDLMNRFEDKIFLFDKGKLTIKLMSEDRILAQLENLDPS